MTKLAKRIRVFAVLVLCAAAAIASPAQTFNTLVIFNATNGEDPFDALVQGVDGNLYGTTVYGGISNYGIVFKMTPSGKLTTLYSFCAQGGCSDGTYPGTLTLGTDGNFYGETYAGGTNNAGTIFKITAHGKLTTLYTFCVRTNCTDGANPQSTLVQGTDGNFYGTAVLGGTKGEGTIFKVTPAGKLATLYNFCSKTNCSDGAQPNIGIIQATDGNFYGVTAFGGRSTQPCVNSLSGCGVVFKITPAGAFTTLYNFCSKTNCTDGSVPQGTLLQAADGSFYGTSDSGGANNLGAVFKVTAAGKFTTLHSFCTGTCADGGVPEAGLIQANDGNLYGTAIIGGPNGYGTVFKITLAGKVTTLHGFNNNDGFSPNGGLVQATDGTFYGGTQEGGDLNCFSPGGCGTIFSLNLGLGPFVETVPTAGKLGTKVMILGTNLTGATSVTFNGTAAKFTVVSKSEITTIVPIGVTTGKVKVVTPTGTLESNLAFRVTH
jgi:uncharacterized repeat protein (TIGR03803 family)